MSDVLRNLVELFLVEMMKPQKFSIHDILTRSPTASPRKLDSTKSNTDDDDSKCIVSLPTPPQSPETKADCLKKSEVTLKAIPSREHGDKSYQKRKRDPIGQILDSLCSKPEKKLCQTPSAFSPIITTPSSPQLSPLSLLSQNETRCIQTSPNLPCTNYQQHVSNEAYSKPQLSREQLQSMEAQKMFQIQKLHHHQQHARFYQRQHQLQNQPLNSVHLPFYVQAGPHRVNQYPQLIPDRQAQLLAMNSYNRSLLLNSYHMGVIGNTTKLAEHLPYALSWIKLANSMDQISPITTTPVKESRILPPPRYQCDACKKSYSTFGGLSKHKQFHCISHVKKEFTCKYCEKSYGSLGALKMHIRTHTLPCKCKLCGKAFSRPWLLQGHVRTHTGEKPFSCAHCGRAFADRSNLRAHLQTHSDIKKYACKNCTKTFSRMSLLLKHEEGSCMGLRR